MDINRNNYQEFFLDYSEGALSPEEVAGLMLFLAQNPDLEEEFNEMELVTLVAETVEFPGKSNLKKEFGGYQFPDQQCIARLESDLSESETGEFDRVLKQDAGLSVLYKQYEKTKLKADSSIRFENKNKLLNIPEKSSRVRLLYPVIAIAASLLLILYFVLPGTNNNTGIVLSSVDTNIIKSKTNFSTSVHLEKPSVKLADIPEKKQDHRIGRDRIAGKSRTTIYEIVPVEKISPRSDSRLAVLDVPDYTPILKKDIIEENTTKSSEMNAQDEADYLTIKEFAAKKLRTNVLKIDKPLNERINVWDFADIGLRKMNSFIGTNISYSRSYSEKTRQKTFALYSNKKEILRKVRKKRK